MLYICHKLIAATEILLFVQPLCSFKAMFVLTNAIFKRKLSGYRTLSRALILHVCYMQKHQIAYTTTIDIIETTYMYEIGNKRAPPIVMYSETLPRIHNARKDLVKGHLSKSFIESVDEQLND